MHIDENWTFEEAVYHISLAYQPGGISTGPLRNRQVEAWGQLAGRTRSLAEFDSTIESYGSLSAFGRKYSITLPILRGFRDFYASLPDDRIRGAIQAGLQIGNWKLIGRLGSGGNAEVWRAKGPTPRSVAIKILKRARGTGLKRFCDEIAVLQSLGDLPGILPLLDNVQLDNIGEAEYVWLVLPIANPLSKAINEQTSSIDILRGIANVANTLAGLHSQDITHRDIKPENLYVWNENWVISDFGIASFPNKQALTWAHKKLGPLHYIAPEMLQHADRADAKMADVYSLAKTLWVLLTGQTYPPPGEQRRDVPAMSINTWIAIENSRIIDELLEQATRHDPGQRPTMQEFRDVIRVII